MTSIGEKEVTKAMEERKGSVHEPRNLIVVTGAPANPGPFLVAKATGLIMAKEPKAMTPRPCAIRVYRAKLWTVEGGIVLGWVVGGGWMAILLGTRIVVKKVDCIVRCR